MNAHWIKCQKCGEQAVCYEVDGVRCRNVKLSYRLLMDFFTLDALAIVLILGPMPAYLIVPTNLFPAAVITFLIFLTINVGIRLAATCKSRFAKVVICNSCGARYSLTEHPEYVRGWNLARLERDLASRGQGAGRG